MISLKGNNLTADDDDDMKYDIHQLAWWKRKSSLNEWND